MATEAQARVSFSTDVPELQNRVPRTPFSVPVNVNASGLSEIVSHLLRLGKAKPQFFSFLVVEDGTLLHSSIENYLVEHHKSSEHVLNLKFFPASHGPEPAASIPCPDWISGISLALPGCVVVSCYNGSAEIRTAHGEEVLTVCAGHSAPVKAVSTCRHGEDGGFRMVTASKDHSLLLWEGNLECSKKASSNEEEATSASVKQVARGHHLKSVECVAMAGPDRFFSGSWDGTVKLWSWPGARNNNSSANDDAGNDDDSEDLPAPAKRSRKPSKAGAAGAAAAGAGAAEEEGGDLLSVATFAGHTNQVSCLTVLESESATAAAAATASGGGSGSNGAAAGRFVVSGSWDHSLRLWDVERFVTLREVNCGKVANDVSCVGAGASVFASAHPDNAIRVWDGRVDASGSVMQLALRGHRGWVSALSPSPTNSNELASVSYDGTLRVWDIRSNRPVHSVPDAHDGKALCVCWDALGGRGIFTGGDDNALNRFSV